MMETSLAAKSKILTKYFYKDNQLCFQLLLNNSDNKQILIGEYTNYGEYRKSFQNLSEKLENNTVVEMKQTTDSVPFRQAA